MRRFLGIAGILAAALPVAAQQGVTQSNKAGSTSATTIQFSARPMNLTAVPDKTAGCPVAMHARQRAAGATMQAGDKPAPPSGAQQRIRLEIEYGPTTVMEAKVTVHGTRGGARATPVEAAADGNRAAGAARSFTVRPGGKANGVKMASDLLLEGFTSVQSISLDSVTFANGQMWVADKGAGCSIMPDPLMLVSQR